VNLFHEPPSSLSPPVDSCMSPQSVPTISIPRTNPNRRYAHLGARAGLPRPIRGCINRTENPRDSPARRNRTLVINGDRGCMDRRPYIPLESSATRGGPFLDIGLRFQRQVHPRPFRKSRSNILLVVQCKLYRLATRASNSRWASVDVADHSSPAAHF
jgi:hypothetical protein